MSNTSSGFSRTELPYLRSDNGPEFVACAILRWLHEAGIETALIDPGKPWQNGAATTTRSARIRVSDT